MSLKVGFVLRVLVVRVDLERVPFNNRAQQIEAGVLIPSAAFVEIDEGEKNRWTEEKREFPMRCDRRRHWRQ